MSSRCRWGSRSLRRPSSGRHRRRVRQVDGVRVDRVEGEVGDLAVDWLPGVELAPARSGVVGAIDGDRVEPGGQIDGAGEHHVRVDRADAEGGDDFVLERRLEDAVVGRLQGPAEVLAAEDAADAADVEHVGVVRVEGEGVDRPVGTVLKGGSRPGVSSGGRRRRSPGAFRRRRGRRPGSGRRGRPRAGWPRRRRGRRRARLARGRRPPCGRCRRRWRRRPPANLPGRWRRPRPVDRPPGRGGPSRRRRPRPVRGGRRGGGSRRRRWGDVGGVAGERYGRSRT